MGCIAPAVGSEYVDECFYKCVLRKYPVDSCVQQSMTCVDFAVEKHSAVFVFVVVSREGFRLGLVGMVTWNTYYY